MDYKDWTYDDFLGYLLIYASHADYIVEREEVRKIIEEIGRSEYSRISTIFDKQSDAERAETISHFGSIYCHSEDTRHKVLDQLQDLLFADKNYRTEEQAFFYGVKMVLGNHFTDSKA